MTDKTAKHPSGATIEFNEERHRYTVGDTVYTSATTVLGEYMNKFNADLISYYVARREGKTKEAVLAEWECKKVEACTFGNRVHRHAELLCLAKYGLTAESERETIAFRYVLNYVSELLDDYFIVEPEKIVFSIAHEVSGTIDVVARHKQTGALALFDWKTSRKIEARNKYSKPCHAPLSHLVDSNFIKYSLQLNLYKRILELEGYYEEVIQELIIVHITEEGCDSLVVADMTGEIDEIFEHRRGLEDRMEANHGI